MKNHSTKRTIVDTRKQLADLKQITPRHFVVDGKWETGYRVVSEGLFSVPCEDRGETFVVLEACKEIFLHHDVASKYVANPAEIKSKKTEAESEKAVEKLCDYINNNVSCMFLEAQPNNHSGFSIDLVRGSGAKVMAKFNSWYKCMIYLRGMCEMINPPIMKY